MTRRLRHCVALASWMVAGSAAAQTGAAFPAEPIPEQAFTEAPTLRIPAPLPSETDVPVRKALPAEAPLGLFQSPALEIAPDTSFADLLDAQKAPPPFYRRWLDGFMDLVAPDDPYRRDKLTLLVGNSVGYDTNVLYSGINPIASSTAGFHAAADYHFGSRRLKLDANLSGGVTYFQNRPGGSSDQNYALTLALEYKLMPRLGITVNTNTAYLSQPSPQLIGGSFQYSGSYFSTNTGATLQYQMRPRFSLSFGFTTSGIQYDDEAINDGSGFAQQNYSISGNWLISPRTTFITQYRYNPVTYNQPGIGSTGQFLLLGIQQSLSPRLTYSLLGGAEFRSLENPAPDSPSSYLGPFVEGSMSYNFAPRSRLIGSLRLGTEPSGTSGVTIRQTFRTSFGVSHSLGSRLTLDGTVGLERDNYDQPGVITDFTQDIYTASMALRYQFALFTYVVLRDDYLFLGSTQPNGSYNHNSISLGLEVQF